MKTSCPCGGLLNPSVAGQAFVWLVHVRLYVFKDQLYPMCLYLLLFFFFYYYYLLIFHLAVLHSVLPNFSLVIPGMAQTV